MNPPLNAGRPSAMNESDHQQVIAEMKSLIDRFEAISMDEKMLKDYIHEGI